MPQIDVSRLIAPILSSRDVFDILDRAVLDSAEKEVVFDFVNVRFVSRSAAHELLKLQKKYKKLFSRKRIKLVNIPRDVQIMFDIVERQQRSTRPRKTAIQNIDFKELSRV